MLTQISNPFVNIINNENKVDHCPRHDEGRNKRTIGCSVGQQTNSITTNGVYQIESKLQDNGKIKDHKIQDMGSKQIMI